MSNKPKVFFVGGFLGAGKTTAIRSLAKIFADKGLKAAAITNDQAIGLVDTLFLSNAGIAVQEVAGSCFCCNFNGLADAISHSVSLDSPDVILAEPVGSCTDIVATVIRPMRSLMKDRVEVCAYSVLVEPDRWFELSRDDAPWSVKYLFEKQLQEADCIVVTKLDTLESGRAEELLEDAARRYPASKVLGISAQEGTGVETWLDLVRTTPPGELWLTEIDYQRYAAAEAEMGWLNGFVTLTFPHSIDGCRVSLRLAESLQQGIGERNGRIGHVKLLGAGDTGSVKVGATQVGEKPILEGNFFGLLSCLELTINMRATLSPGDLSCILHDALSQFRDFDNAETDISVLNTFRPGAPNPTYRYGA